MKTTLKRALAFLFAFVMVVSLVPASMLAEDNGEAPVVDETVVVPAEEAPSTDIPEPTPDTEYTGGGYTEAPAEEEAPVEEPAEEAPAEEAPAEEAPVEEPAEETPVADPTEEAPAADPTEEAPAEEPTEEEAAVAEQKAIAVKPVETPAAVIPGEGSGSADILIDKIPINPTPTGFKITFKGNGGILSGVAASDYTTTAYYEAGASVKISTALEGKSFIHKLSADFSTNYRFLGWNTAQDGSGTMYQNTDTVTMPNSALTLYAQWEPYEWIYWLVRMDEGGAQIEYAFGTVQSFKAYCGNQGNSAGMVSAAYYSPVKAVAKEGYTFLGWYYGEQLITKGDLTETVFRNLPKLTMETSGAVLEARFSDKIVITYTDGVDDEVVFEDQVHLVEKGDPTPAFEGTPVRTGCEFLGWSPEVAVTAEESVTYVAQWKVNIPPDPSYDTVGEKMYTLHCTADAAHADQDWKWYSDTYVKYNKDKAFNEERQVWTATASVTMSVHLTSYKNKVTPDRTHFCDQKNVNISLVWSDQQNRWLPDGANVIDIYCYTAPAAPTSAAKLSKGNGIWVKDTDDTKNNTKYTGKKLLEGTYSFGAVTKDEDGTFWSSLTVTNLQPYVDAFDAKYNAGGTKAPYVIDADSTTATFSYILKYTGSTLDYKQDGTGWSIDDSSFANNTEKLNGKTLYVYSRYKVTYTDGVEGEEIFADQVYMIPAGEATPAFQGTPTRTNWNFKGWNPEVSDEATGNVTYVAQWEKATNNKPANIRENDVRKMKISAYAKGTAPIYTTGDDWWYGSQVGNTVAYTIGSVEGNDVDGYTTTVTFHFKSGDTFESNARGKFNSNTYSVWHPAWQGNWSYSFDAGRPADQTLTLYWVITVDSLGRLTGKWCILNAAGTGYAPNIDTAVSALIKVNLSLSRTVTYTDGVEDAELFADQSYTVSNGSATPAFVGTPIREGYRFDGWTPELAEKVYADAVYTAKWVKTYTVTYSDGKGGTLFADEVHVVDEGVATPAFEGSTEYAGWIFNGWNPIVAAQVNDDATYVALWLPGPFNILRLDGNGSVGNRIFDTSWSGESAILNSDGSEFSYPGHVFAGWNTEQDGTGITYVNGDSIPFEVAHNGEVVVLYAQWEPISVTVTYTDGVEGEEVFADQSYTVVYNSDTPAFEGTPKRTGYTFAGWEPAIAEKVGAEDVTYTAKWEPISVTVTYTDGVGGAAFKDQVFNLHYGDAVPAFEGTPARKGYRFLGWDVEAPEPVTEDITFTAKWGRINDSDVPNTGDSDRILRPAVLMGALLLLGAGAAMVVVNKRKQEN